MSMAAELIKLFMSLQILSFIMTNTNSYSLNTTTSCPNYTCNSNNQFNIRYPFHEISPLNPPNQYCGYPQFGLTCSPSNETILVLARETYIVKYIDYDNKTLTLIDAEVHASLNNCPRANHNVSLTSRSLLKFYRGNLDLNFYFNCTASEDVDVGYIECLLYGIDDPRRSYVFSAGNETEGYGWESMCEEKVVVPVMKDKINEDDLIGGFGVAMKQGFMVDWSTGKECDSCEKNGGQCGYNRSRGDELICYCKNGDISNHSCSRGTGLDHKLKLIIGFAASGGSIIVMLITFFIYQRCCNRKKPFASSYLSQTISSDFSSVTDIETVGNYFGLHIFTYAELEEATNYFDSSQEVGDGGFGTVYHGKLKDGRVVAIKRLYENNYKRVEQFMNEVEILTRLRHKNLVSLYGCTSRHSHELLLVYEYIPNGTIADHLHGEKANPSSLSWPIRLKIAIETADALVYLHACEIIHRDVKTNNILLDNSFCVKVADFGLSRLFPTDVTHVSTAPQGTPGYLDPDYHRCYQLTHKSDVYSFGVVLIELISSKPAVDITRHRHEINLSTMAINKIKGGALHEIVDPSFGIESNGKVKKMVEQVADLAYMCLQTEKDMRPSMKDVLNSLIEILSEEKNVVKPKEVQSLADDAVLLKNCPVPFLTDSDTEKWNSSSSTTATHASG